MPATTIILIIIGIICIFTSCFAVSKSDKNEEKITDGVKDELSEKDKEHIRELVDSYMHEYIESKLPEIEERINQFLDNKTNILSEYVDAIKEDLKQNSNEVSIMYNMINDKQKEIKLTATLVDEYKKGVEKMISDNRKEKDAPDKSVVNDKENAPTESDIERETDFKQETEFQEKEDSKAEDETQAEINESGFKDETDEENVNKNHDIDNDDKYDEYADEFAENYDEGIDAGDNVEESVMNMYKSGLSILEIGRTLGLGVGEVKKIVDAKHGE